METIVQEVKRKAIQNAYGDAWEKVKEFVDGKGWIHNCPWDIESVLFPQSNGFEVGDVDKMHLVNSFSWRPRCLSGLESNNGWTRIEEKMPPSSEDRFYVCFEGVISGWTESGENIHKTCALHNKHPDVYKNITHWRPVEKLINPLY